MKFPSKIISYDESILSKLVPIIKELIEGDITVFALYNKTKKIYNDIEEYIDALDCLFSIKKVEYLVNKGVLHYVERNIL